MANSGPVPDALSDLMPHNSPRQVPAAPVVATTTSKLMDSPLNVCADAGVFTVTAVNCDPPIFTRTVKLVADATLSYVPHTRMWYIEPCGGWAGMDTDMTDVSVVVLPTVVVVNLDVFVPTAESIASRFAFSVARLYGSAVPGVGFTKPRTGVVVVAI